MGTASAIVSGHSACLWDSVNHRVVEWLSGGRLFASEADAAAKAEAAFAGRVQSGQKLSIQPQRAMRLADINTFADHAIKARRRSGLVCHASYLGEFRAEMFVATGVLPIGDIAPDVLVDRRLAGWWIAFFWHLCRGGAEDEVYEAAERGLHDYEIHEALSFFQCSREPSGAGR
jgi:hypothetical protein